MKKLVAILFLSIGTIGLAQESVKLRVNYNKGDIYKMEMSQNVSSPQMVMDMKISSTLNIVDVNEGIYNSERKITKVVLDIMQGMNAISYDSSKSDEDLDEMGMMMKSQMSPMLKAVISSKTNNLGKVLESSTSVAFQGSENLGKSNVVFPEGAVKVGDTFEVKEATAGVTITTVFTVKSISEKNVVLSMAATGAADIKGTMTLDRVSGVALKSDVITKIEAQGVTTTMKLVTTKM
ncbi:hypothetical protein [Polaribacter ponticola]|uniref:Uncharacterized protein n=1 Tax=Polaribacter ponticola TaxID=2978475 RepID=A0ABT5S8Z2_9FLAO|nr:hypothetical protein [Polaribacter sp. MSW5]MDD7914553.1 hypothetical protein [Polaribacter sp. MSW5]